GSTVRAAFSSAEPLAVAAEAAAGKRSGWIRRSVLSRQTNAMPVTLIATKTASIPMPIQRWTASHSRRTRARALAGRAFAGACMSDGLRRCLRLAGREPVRGRDLVDEDADLSRLHAEMQGGGICHGAREAAFCLFAAAFEDI